MSKQDIYALLNFWFNGQFGIFRPEWFSSTLDDQIREQFGQLHKLAEIVELEELKATKYGRLAYIILLDQFTRNLYRSEDFRKNLRSMIAKQFKNVVSNSSGTEGAVE